MRTSPRRTAALALALALFVVAPPPAAAAGEDETALARFGWGLGAGLCTLVYTPVKVVYAATAIPLGGLVWIFSVGDAEIASRVIERATAGDFVVTPEHLKRERTLVFFARGDSGEPSRSDAEDDARSGG